MARFLHVSDTHLGKTVYGSAARRADFTDAFVQALELAVEEDVDAVVHTGDLTDSSEWDETLPERALDALEALAAQDIPFLFVLGNHDTTDSGRPQAWVSELESANLGTRLSTEAHDVAGVAVYGVDYHEDDWWVDPDIDFEPAIGDPPTFLALHQAVEPFAPDGRGELDLAPFLDRSHVAFDAVLLGHKHSTLERTVDGTLATYAGTTERVTRAERDNTPKVNFLTVTDDGVTREDRELETRPFPEWTVVAGPEDDASTLRDALTDVLPGASVLTLNLVSRDGTAVDAATVSDAVAPLEPLDVSIRDAVDEHGAAPGVYAGDPAALADAPAAEAGTTAKPDVATDRDEETVEPPEPDPGTEPAVGESAGTTVEDADTRYGAYLARLPERDGVCDFVLDPERWADHFGVDVSRDEWACPRDAADGCCQFHTPLDEREASPADTVDAFCEAVEAGSETAFVGARFASLDLSFRYLDGPHNYPVDLSYARVDDGVNLSQCVVGNQLRLVGVAAERVHAEGATFEAAVDARDLAVAGTAEFGSAQFERTADFRDAAFQTGHFTGCVFGYDATFDDASFAGKANFEEAEFAHRATFQETGFEAQAVFEHCRFGSRANFKRATFGDDARFEEAEFSHRGRFQGATFAAEAVFEHCRFGGGANFRRATFRGRANFFAVQVEQFFGCYEATFESSASFYSAGFAQVTQVRNADFEGDANFKTATFGHQEVKFDGTTVAGEADFTRARFAGRVAFESATNGAAAFEGPVQFTRATFADDAAFAGVDFGGRARFDRTTWKGKATFGDALEDAADGAATFDREAVFDRAKFHEDVNCEGVEWRGLFSAADVHVRGEFDASGATVGDGATFAASEFRTLRLDAVQTEDGDPVVSLVDTEVTRGSVDQRGPSPPLYDLTRATLGNVTVTGDEAAAPAFDTLFVNQTTFDGFEFTSSYDHVPDSWLLHRLDDRYDDVVRPTLSARETETTYRNAKHGADAAGDSRASAELFQHEMAFRQDTYAETLPPNPDWRARATGKWQEWRNRALGTTTGYGEQTGRVVLTGLFAMLVFFPSLYAAVDAVSPGSLAGGYGEPAGYLRLSLEAFVALVLGDPSAVSGLVARLLVYGEALVGTLLVAMLVLTLTRSVYR